MQRPGFLARVWNRSVRIDLVAQILANRDAVLRDTRGDAISVMLYGSAARGDSTPQSDVDVLELVPSHPGMEVRGHISVVRYTPEQVAAMVAGGSIFAWHLRTEGIYLRDDGQVLEQLLGQHPGVHADQTIRRVQAMSAVLDVGAEEFSVYGRALTRMMRFLLRTAVYARAFDLGQQTFALATAAACVDPSGGLAGELEVLKTGEGVDWQVFRRCLDRLDDLAGPLRTNEFLSLEALVVRTELIEPDIHSLGLHVLSHVAGELDYATIGMPVL